MNDDELDKLFGMDGDESGEPEHIEDTEEAAEDSGVVSAREVRKSHTKKIVPEEHNRKDREPEDIEVYEEPEEVAEDEEPEDEGPDISAVEREFFRKFPISFKGVLLTLLGIAVITGIVLVFTLDSFRIKTIDVEGNYVFTDEELIELSGIEYNGHLFFANYYKAANNIKDHSPYVSDCKVSFVFPSTVKINVTERSKICYVKTPDGYAALDEDGIVLELSSFDSHHNVMPVVSGLDITHATLGKEIVIGNPSDYQKALIVLGSLLAADTNNTNKEYSIFNNTEEVRILPSGYIFLTIKLPNSNRLQVKFDSLEKISTQTSWLLYAIESKVFDKGFANGSLDMTMDQPVYRQFVINNDTTESTSESSAESTTETTSESAPEDNEQGA